jgi:hypothetical protein
MYKTIDLPAYGADGTATVQALFPVGNGFKVKVAESRVNPDVTEFVAKIKPSPEKLYVLLNAVGAGEFYGDNQNADYFAEKDLDRDSDLAGYRTFYNAGVYRNHQNKDKAKSFGKVIFAAYNRVMRRVELIIEIDRALAKEFGHEDLLVKLDSGVPVAVSMGCRVKFDVCRICGHKSYKPDGSDRCVCMRTMMRQLMPDGRKVCVDNPDPVFFDISFVVIGADRTSFAMQKVASVFAQEGLHKEASLRGLRSGLAEKLASRRKRADLIKDVPAMARQVSPALARVQPDMSFGQLHGLSSRFNLPTLASSLGAGGVVLSPREYQTIVLVRAGRPDMAEKLYDSGEVFPHSSSASGAPPIISGSNVSGSLLSDILDVVLSRSALGDGLLDQLSSRNLCPRHAVANAAYKRLIPFSEKSVLPQLSAPYTGYRLGLMQNMPNLIGSLMRQNPALLSTLSASDPRGGHTFGEGPRSNVLSALPMAYLYSAYARDNTGHAGRLGDLEAYVEQNPTLAASILLGLLKLGELVQQLRL